MDPYAYVGDSPETNNDPTGNYYATSVGITQRGGAIGYVMPGSDVITTAINDGGGNYRSLDGSDTWNYGSIDVNTFTRAQENAYGSYNPNTDPNNTPFAKFQRVIGWDKLQQTWSNPNATWQDKAGALGQFALTNLNNALQLTMIVGMPEGGEGAAILDEGATAAEEEGGTIVEDVVSSCGGLSFTPTTPVATDHGEQAIGTMHVGEKVLAFNPTTHKMELQPVLHVWLNHDNDLIDLTLTSITHHGKGVTKTSETIHTNKKHPFLTKEKGFLPVGQLKLGMHVLRADGTYGVVTGWKIVPGIKVMYNLEVAQDHTFVVGVGEWVVHNCGDVPVNTRGDPYPRVIDPRTGQEMPFPQGDLQRVDPSSRVDWNPSADRDAFIKEWYNRGYKDLPKSWGDYDLHHILPREFGGTNDFWNLIPIEREIHQGPAPFGVTAWWNAFFP